MTRNKIIIIGIAGLIILFLVLVFFGIIPGLKKPDNNKGFDTIGNKKQTVLNFWGIINSNNDEKAIQSIIEEYQKINKEIKIDFQPFNDEFVYEKTLINALATGKSPDILMFHNNWFSKHGDKVAPIPETLLSLTRLRQLFPQIVEQDFVFQQQDKFFIVALPLYIDTLAFFYNKDIFDAKSIALPPTDWQSFQNLIPFLRETNLSNQITKAGAAIAGSEKSINAASDLLNLLMMQFGSKMVDNYGKINFEQAGLEALNFYIQFSNPNNKYYTWNDDLRYSLDSFSDGSTAIIFNYASQIPLIKEKNPYLNIGIAEMLQLANVSQPINYANYWGLSVSNQSKNFNSAWDFILFSAINPQTAEIYIQTAKKPPALRSLIQKYINDPELGIFSKQALTARNWRQPDNIAVKQIFSDMLKSILSGRINAEDALKQAENEINEL